MVKGGTQNPTLISFNICVSDLLKLDIFSPLCYNFGVEYALEFNIKVKVK